MSDFVEALVNACNPNTYLHDNINTSLVMENGQAMFLVDGDFDLKIYIQQVGTEIILRSYGDKERAGQFFHLSFFPFSTNGVDRVYNEDGTVRGFRVKITPEVVHNLKLYFAVSFQKFVADGMLGKFVWAPDELKGTILKFLQSIRLGKMGGDIKDLYSIELHDVESADAQMNKTLKDIYVEMFRAHLDNCDLKPSDFFQLHNCNLKDPDSLQLVDNRLYVKDFTDAKTVENITKYITEHVALNVIIGGNTNHKAKNIRDVLRSKIFDLTKENEGKGILIDGYRHDTFTDKHKVEGGYDFVLIPSVEVNGGPEPLSIKEADSINEAFRKKGLGCILANIAGKTKDTQGVDGPVYAVLIKPLASLVTEFGRYPLVYNEASGYFEHAVNLGLQQCKSREHYDLKDDLYRILLPKFYKDGYLDEKGLSEASKYIYSCLLKSGFGSDGYEIPELAEFVDKKIKELLSANRAIPQATNNTLQVPVDPMSDSTHSNDSGCDTDSPSGSPKRQPRPVAFPDPKQNSQSGQKTVQHADETCSAKLPASSSQQEPHGLHNEKTSTELKAPKLTRPVPKAQKAQEGCSIS